MQFIADNMLGKLAKWLRFMGYDTLYPKIVDDKDLIKLCRTEDRCLLTRDKELAKNTDIEVCYIDSEKSEKQLKQVINEFNLTLDGQEFSRCPECNHLLKEMNKSQLNNTDKIPDGVLERQELFWVCSGCQRHYWRGTHYQKIKTKLNDLFE